MPPDMAQYPPIWLNGFPIDMPVAIIWQFGAPIDVLSGERQPRVLVWEHVVVDNHPCLPEFWPVGLNAGLSALPSGSGAAPAWPHVA